MIELCGISKRFDTQTVLQSLNWRIGVGEQWLLVGPSGIGKTTLLRILMGTEKADSGTRSCAHTLRFAPVFQEDRLLDARSALENVLLVCRGRTDAPRARQVLCELLPEEAIDRAASTLSGGMRRRVALARALLAPSDVLVMDEPFAGLDEQTQAQAVECIARHCAGRALILAAHGFTPLQGMKTLRLGE